MLFRKKPAEERSPQELEIALQEAEMPQKGLKPFLHKNGKKLVAVLVIAAILVVLLMPKGQKKAVNAETAYTQVTPENRDITNVYSESGVLNAANSYTVKATVKGDVLTADFEVGDVVEKGAVLYTIDSSDVVSGVEKAELNLGQAQRSYDDAVDAQYIRTDIAGTVASFKVRVGDVVNAGQEVATIRDDTTLLLELVNEVLDMGKLESGEMVLENVPFDLPELMHEITDVLEKQAAERGIVLHREYGRLPHPRLVGSPLHVKRLLMNVLSNAIKYNREKGRVMLDCFELSSNGDKAQICFVCADTGIGMSEEFQKRMFEPFAQENAGARSVYGGTGLGTSIAKSLVDKMGGTIGVESKQGVGTTYTITLPFAIDNTATEEPERQQTDLTVLQGRQLLLAEDNALNMEIMEFLLSDVGIKVTKAVDGQQAVEAFAASPPGGFDAILMDVMMPVRDGHEATRAIRAMDRPDAKTIPIFAMTANAFTEDRRKALESGMNEHLPKPIDPDALYRLLVKYLTERS